MSKGPKRIWLQGVGTGEVTWCGSRVEDDDVEYVRADEYRKLERAVKENDDFIKKAFEVHPNLDLDIKASGR